MRFVVEIPREIFRITQILLIFRNYSKIIILLLILQFTLPISCMSHSPSCDYRIRNWEYIGSHYQCAIEGVFSKVPNYTVTFLKGIHDTAKTSDVIRAFYMGDTVLHYMPKGLEKIFRNIEGFQIYNTELKVITQDDLRPFPKIRGIWLSGNQLKTIDSGTFKYNPDLKLIDLSENRIRHIAADVFDPIDNLADVFLMNNVCVSRNEKGRALVNEIQWEIIQKCQMETQKDSNGKCKN